MLIVAAAPISNPLALQDAQTPHPLRPGKLPTLFKHPPIQSYSQPISRFVSIQFAGSTRSAMTPIVASARSVLAFLLRADIWLVRLCAGTTPRALGRQSAI